MISSSQTKLLRSLQMKKHRDRQRLYTVEGSKMALDLIKGVGDKGHRPERIFATGEWIAAHAKLLGSLTDRVVEGTENELRKISNMVTPQPVVCLVNMPEKSSLETGQSGKSGEVVDRPEKEGPEQNIPDGPILVFESIRDPGNLGTIMRTANWFGISMLVCSPDSVDQYNPKVVQATMGAIFRVTVNYRELEGWLSGLVKDKHRIFGTFLEGESIYRSDLGGAPVILFGNESHGLSNNYDRYLDRKIAIPPFFGRKEGPESLNVASTVAVVCSEIRREAPGSIRSGN